MHLDAWTRAGLTRLEARCWVRRAAGEDVAAIADALGISRRAVYRACGRSRAKVARCARAGEWSGIRQELLAEACEILECFENRQVLRRTASQPLADEWGRPVVLRGRLVLPEDLVPEDLLSRP